MTLVCACGKHLMVSSSHAGRKVACPACGASHVVPANVSSAAAKPAMLKPPRRSRASGLFGVLAALAIVAVVVAGVWWWRGAEGPTVDALAYVPADADALAVVRLREVWAMVEPVQANAWATTCERDTGMRPEQVECAWLVSKDVANDVGWIVVRTVARYDRNKLLARLEHRIVQLAGRHRMVVGTTKANGGKGALAFLDARTLLVGSEAGVRQALASADAPATKAGPLAQVLDDAKTSVFTAGAAPTPHGVEVLEARGLTGGVRGGKRATLRVSLEDGEQIEALAEFADEEEAIRLATAALKLKVAAGALGLWLVEESTREALERLVGEAKVERLGTAVRLRLRGNAGDLGKALRLLESQMRR